VRCLPERDDSIGWAESEFTKSGDAASQRPNRLTSQAQLEVLLPLAGLALKRGVVDVGCLHLQDARASFDVSRCWRLAALAVRLTAFFNLRCLAWMRLRRESDMLGIERFPMTALGGPACVDEPGGILPRAARSVDKGALRAAMTLQ
jgi:hypothetical protein